MATFLFERTSGDYGDTFGAPDSGPANQSTRPLKAGQAAEGQNEQFGTSKYIRKNPGRQSLFATGWKARSSRLLMLPKQVANRKFN
jgi:hypothetical protein